MIGSITYPVPVTSIGSDPSGIRTSDFYNYTTADGYLVADSIKPGYGYWVKTSEAGKLLLSSMGNMPMSSRIKIIASTELPPAPPDEIVLGAGKLIPTKYELKQNYPNPFNPTTSVSFVIGQSPARQHSGGSLVNLKVFNVLGKEVATLVNEVKQPGEYTVQWNAEGVPSGIYFYRLTAGSYINTKKLVLIK
jgi:hypothetical protein